MIRRTVRIGLTVGGLLGGAAAVARTARARRSGSGAVTPPTPEWPPLHVAEEDPAVDITASDDAVAREPALASAVSAATNGLSDPAGTMASAAPVAAPDRVPNPIPDPVVPDDDADVTVAPGPDPQPLRDDEPATEPGGAPEGEGAWVEASAGSCPTSHPVKGKLSSRIYHEPGMLNYDRTRADRCYLDGAAAEADGLRIAKR
jgi:hypothetical protein